MATDRNGDGRIDIHLEETRRELDALSAAGSGFQAKWAPLRSSIEELTKQLGRGKMGEMFQDCKTNTPLLIKSADSVAVNYENVATNGRTGVKVYEDGQTEATQRFGT
ncbi:hypothetical protein [Amycolatopsis decaplanina]|uniref:hypothetical protein n=1 Tax=Amycolatopsis decaplanina TaxID=208441 RepID=UPI000348BA2B|nr:hypothetical protein [Amycolatopsis decaplanina]